jgi:hypothetical protein
VRLLDFGDQRVDSEQEFLSTRHGQSVSMREQVPWSTTSPARLATRP